MAAPARRKTPPLDDLFWEDLWAPLRFAVPATHPVEVECTSRHLPGDCTTIFEGRTITVYRQSLQGWDAAVKILNFSLYPHRRGEMRREKKIYDKLKGLQGDVVPRLLWYGEIVDDWIDALVTEYVGEALEDGNMTAERRQGAIRALDAVHAAGVLHGDVAMRNFCAQDDKVYIIDFGQAKFRKECPDWDAEVAKECAELLREFTLP